MSRWLGLLALLLVLLPLAAPLSAAERPNVVLILADDLGYGDLGVTGCKDIPTPHIDALAAGGVRCTNGYVSAPQCSPTRAGLLTGRYQQRFGHEHNSAHENSNLPLSEVTLAKRLEDAGYATGLVGKWHLGTDEKHHPLDRGFDEFFGFVGGANPYLPQGPQNVVPRILRGHEPANEKTYLTDAFGREAVAFIDRHKAEPFFLYLAFNAPHGPLQATKERLKQFESIDDETRRTYAAMVSALDDAMGAVLAKLRSEGLEENTLVAFLSDNGGPTDVNGSSNAPFRGVKGETREGGIHVPFVVRWPAKLAPGSTFEHPVIQLDLFTTALDAAGIAIGPNESLDGVSLLPHLTGESDRPPHEALYWRFNFPPTQPDRHKWAIRQGDWKLLTDVGNRREGEAPKRRRADRPAADRNRERPRRSDQPTASESIKLVDLSEDVREETDLTEKHPQVAAELKAAWERWNAQLASPGQTPGQTPGGQR